jgi:HSP20 family molecular chaperone IbpA
MKVDNDILKEMDNKIRKKINLKEQELEKIDKIYDKRIEQANSLADDKYVDVLDRNKQRIVVANQEYEDKLKNYQDSLAKTKIDTETNEQKALDLTKEKQHILKDQSEEKYSKIYNNARDTQDELFEKSQNDARQLDKKSRLEKIAHEGHAKQELASFASALQQNTRGQEENLKSQLGSEQAAMAHTLTQNKMDTQIRLTESTIKNKRIEDEQKRVQEEKLKLLDQYQSNLVKQKQSDFQVRYQKMSEEHQAILNNLTAKLAKTTQEALAANAVDKKAITDLNNDPFYRLEILKPKVSEDAMNYYVHLEVPEHEKENVHLMAHGREIRITMSRKYTSSLDDTDGSTNRTSKTQLYSKDFPTDDLTNPKNITQKYENGVLSFKVAKL